MLPRPPHEPAGRWSQRIRVPVRDPGQGNGCVSVGGLLCTRRDLTRQRRYRFPTWIARDASFGVRQPCCRAHRAHDPVRGKPLPLLVTGMSGVFVTIIESVRHE
ncbi:hypothetical protein [Chloroflexus sp.]|jgi:hypothetical protein|uniref:hypothetical protein n=1 Tax=Chloroflexus sp. TaxID=1904827 RepID=UPI00257EFE92|nr:hypothetical protein [Chloroflexus sp.]